jgi:peptide/nickel transport system permease protein
VAIAVMYAYLLGFTVFLLDFLYAMVDPRVRIGDEGKQ